MGARSGGDGIRLMETGGEVTPGEPVPQRKPLSSDQGGFCWVCIQTWQVWRSAMIACGLLKALPILEAGPPEAGR